MGEIKNEVIAYGLKIIDNGAISYVDGQILLLVLNESASSGCIEVNLSVFFGSIL